MLKIDIPGGQKTSPERAAEIWMTRAQYGASEITLGMDADFGDDQSRRFRSVTGDFPALALFVGPNPRLAFYINTDTPTRDDNAIICPTHLLEKTLA